jgi:hypothetical protein
LSRSKTILLLIAAAALVVVAAKYLRPRPGPSWRIDHHLPPEARAAAAGELEERAVVLDPREWRIGERIEDLEFTDTRGEPGRLSDFARRAALVIAIRDPDCPVSQRYGPRLADLSRTWTERGVAFLFVAPHPAGGAAAASADCARFGLTGRCIVDPSGRFGRSLEIRTTTEVFVLDRTRTLVYRGAIDDQYGRGVARPEPKRRFLVDALEALSDDGTIDPAATSAPGCLLDFEAPPATGSGAAEVTFHDQVSRILQRNCERCHRDGGMGPFPLVDYEDAFAHRKMLAFVVEKRVMPPWFAAPGSGPWSNDPTLSDAERDDLLGWVRAGCPEGEPADAPLPRTWPEGWTIGEPDFVIRIPEPIQIPAEGVLPYVKLDVESHLPRDLWVDGLQVLPDVPKVVHHVLVYYRVEEKRDKFLTVLLPGKPASISPEGYARFVPKDAKIHFEIHYTPNGTACTDQLRLGLHEARQPPTREIFSRMIRNPDFTIPAGDPDFVVRATWSVPEDVELLRFLPHMHLRGKSMRVDVRPPGGELRNVLVLPKWDPDWQLPYQLATPIPVPAGTEILCEAHFDNSAANPDNPDPTQDVHEGEQIWQEMMGVVVEWTAQ